MAAHLESKLCSYRNLVSCKDSLQRPISCSDKDAWNIKLHLLKWIKSFPGFENNYWKVINSPTPVLFYLYSIAGFIVSRSQISLPYLSRRNSSFNQTVQPNKLFSNCSHSVHENCNLPYTEAPCKLFSQLFLNSSL